MPSITDATGNYRLEPALSATHNQTRDWLSTTMLWKNELAFFQKMLDATAHFFTSTDDKKKVSHFQILILYYRTDLLIDLSEKLRDHESHLAIMLRTGNGGDRVYYREHKAIVFELNAFLTQFLSLKNEFFQFIEKLKDLPDD